MSLQKSLENDSVPNNGLPEIAKAAKDNEMSLTSVSKYDYKLQLIL